MKPYVRSLKVKSEAKETSQNITRQHRENTMADQRRSEKDSGNESEPELSSCDFSKLNISPKPIHARPSAVRILSKKSALAQQLEKDSATGNTQHKTDTVRVSPSSSGNVIPEENRQPVTGADYSRCLRSRIIRHSNKVGFVSCSSSNSTRNNDSKSASSSTVRDGPTQLKPAPNHQTDSENNYLTSSAFHHAAHSVTAPQTMTLANISSSRRGKPAFDSLSLHSVASEEFMESDDELISINSDSNISAASLSMGSTRRHSSKRKRTTTLSADLEVESLLSASGEDSLSSCGGDNQSTSDLSEYEVVDVSTSVIPRKRHCSGAPSVDSDSNRPFLDLEKMQDKVEEIACTKTQRRKPKAIRIMCFSPIKSVAGVGSQYNDKEMLMSTRFCPLTPVEHPAVC